MSKSREQKIAEALGRSVIWVAKEDGDVVGATIRDRVRELLDESGLCFAFIRNPGGQNHMTAGKKKWDFNSGWFPDSELSKKLQDLLIWLAAQGA